MGTHVKGSSSPIYQELGIEASKASWEALGLTVYTDGTLGHGTRWPQDVHGVLLQAVHETGARDERAVAWALGELQRQAETDNQSRAQFAEADALKALAAALREMGDENALQSILGRLSERTQYAVRQQLRRS